MKRRVIILLILISLAAGTVSCIQFKKMELTGSVSGAADDLMLSSTAYAALLSTVTGQQDTPETKSPAPPARVFTAVHKRGRLFIRKGPSTAYPIIGFLSPGDTGHVIRDENGWALVDTGELTGYVSMNYLTLEEKPE